MNRPASLSTFLRAEGDSKAWYRSMIHRIGESADVAWTKWSSFWFHPSDPFGLAILRWLVGGMLLYSHLIWGLALEDFFGPAGWNNQGVVQAMQQESYAWSFWWHVPEGWYLPVHLGCTLLLFLFWIGAATRVTGPAAWIIGVSYAHRAMLANFGLDQIVCCLVLYLALAPSGACLSFDAWLRRRTGRAPLGPSIMSTVSMRLVQVHLCVMYFFAGIAKLQGESWHSGNAVWQSLANFEYQSLDLTFLAHFPLMTELATVTTVLWEISFAVLVWQKSLRPWVLILGVGMHLGIGMFLGMWTFGFAMMFGYITFVPTPQLRSIVNFVSRRHRHAAHSVLPPHAPRPTNPVPGSSHPVTSLPSTAPVPLSGIVVIAKSHEQGNRICRYFHRHFDSVYLVDGMVHANKLAEVEGNHLLICLIPEFNRAEIMHWFQQTRHSNPIAKMVFISRDFTASAQDGFAVVSPDSSFRTMRETAETLLGEKLVSRSTQNRLADKDSHDPDSHSADSPGSSAEPAPVDPNTGETRSTSSRLRVAKSLVGLVITLSLAGCGRSSASSESLVDRAAMLNDRGQYDEALHLINQITDQDRGNASAFYLAGVAHEQLGQLDEANEAYSRCLANEPRHTDALNNRGVIRGRLGQFEAAISDLSEAVQYNPDDEVALGNLGLAYHELGRFQQAIESYDQGIQLTPNAQLHFQRGNANLALHDYPEAIADYGKAIEQRPEFARAYLNRAMAHLKSGHADTGKADLMRAEQADDDMTIAPIVMNVRPLFENHDLQSRAIAQVRQWLEARGWETQSDPGMAHFLASRIPVAGAASEPSAPNEISDDFAGVVLTADSLENVYGNFETMNAAMKHAGRLSLFVVDPTELSNQQVSSIDGRPMWLLHADDDWEPARDHFQPHTVRLIMPTTSGKKMTMKQTQNQ